MCNRENCVERERVRGKERAREHRETWREREVFFLHPFFLPPCFYSFPIHSFIQSLHPSFFLPSFPLSFLPSWKCSQYSLSAPCQKGELWIKVSTFMQVFIPNAWSAFLASHLGLVCLHRAAAKSWSLHFNNPYLQHPSKHNHHLISRSSCLL